MAYDFGLRAVLRSAPAGVMRLSRARVARPVIGRAWVFSNASIAWRRAGAVAAVDGAGIELEALQRLLQLAHLRGRRQDRGLLEQLELLGEHGGADAGVGHRVRLQPLGDLAVLHDHLGLHVGADVDADHLGALRALEQQRRARRGAARVAGVQEQLGGIGEILRDGAPVGRLEALGNAAGPRVGEPPGREVAVVGDLKYAVGAGVRDDLLQRQHAYRTARPWSRPAATAGPLPNPWWHRWAGAR